VAGLSFVTVFNVAQCSIRQARTDAQQRAVQSDIDQREAERKQAAAEQESEASDYGSGYSGGSHYRSRRSGGSGSRDVHVRGYTRRDGTYVRPHYRSRPRR
jgi:hypothetical protein